MSRYLIPYERTHELAARFGIKLAKGQFVDMADEAIDLSRNGGFAIRLRLVPAAGGDELFVRRLEDPAQIRRAYERFSRLIPANPGARILAEREGHGGRQLELSGRLDEANRKLIELSAHSRAGNEREVIADVLPIDEAEAKKMVETLREKQILPAQQHILRTLVDLIVHSARMFEKSPIASFTFDPVQLSPAGYEVLSATMTSPRHLDHQPRKFARRERDRKGYYAPSGKQ